MDGPTFIFLLFKMRECAQILRLKLHNEKQENKPYIVERPFCKNLFLLFYYLFIYVLFKFVVRSYFKPSFFYFLFYFIFIFIFFPANKK